MTNPLILELKIRREKLKKDSQSLQIKIARLVNELTVYVATYYGDGEDIDTEKIKQISDELHSTKTELFRTKSSLEKVNKDIGDE